MIMALWDVLKPHHSLPLLPAQQNLSCFEDFLFEGYSLLFCFGKSHAGTRTNPKTLVLFVATPGTQWGSWGCTLTVLRGIAAGAQDYNPQLLELRTTIPNYCNSFLAGFTSWHCCWQAVCSTAWSTRAVLGLLPIHFLGGLECWINFELSQLLLPIMSGCFRWSLRLI